MPPTLDDPEPGPPKMRRRGHGLEQLLASPRSAVVPPKFQSGPGWPIYSWRIRMTDSEKDAAR